MIIADDPPETDELQGTLRRLGYRVLSSHSIENISIQVVWDENPDLILMKLPPEDNDAIALSQELREKTGTPVIYLTPEITSSTMSRTLQTDPFGYVLKPINEKNLIIVIETALQRLQSERELKQSKELYQLLVENINDVLYTLDVNGNITYISPVIERVSKYRIDELAGRNFTDFIHPEDLPGLLESYNRTIEGHIEPSEFRIFDKDGSVRHVRTSSHTIERNGKIVGLTAIMTDITEKKLAEGALRESEKRYRELVENATDMIYGTDNTGHLTIINPVATRTLGYAEEEIFGKHYLELIHPDYRREAERFYGIQFVKKIPNTYYELPVIKKDGSVIWIGQNTQLVMEDNTVIGFQSVARDITQRKLTEEALQESVNRNEAILQAMPDMMFILTRDGTYVDFYAKFDEELAIPREEILGKNIRDAGFTDEDVALIHEKIEEVLSGGTMKTINYQLKTPKGLGTYEARLVKFGDDRVLTIVRDITEVREAEEKLRETEERYRSLFERSFDAIFIADFEGNFIDANDKALELLGFNRDDIRKINYAKLLDEEQLPIALERARKLLESENYLPTSEFKLKRSDGTHVWIETSSSMIYRDGTPYAIQGLARNITDRKKAEEQIKASLKEKEILLKEIHHRVKNNLQIIKSLLNLQVRTIHDEELQRLFSDSQDRIRAIALIHEKLYQSKDLSRIDFSEYIKTMAEELYRTHINNRDRIRLHTELESILLNIQQALPCGLILNELLTNTFKYAFPSGWDKQGEIRISLQKKNTTLILTVSDNGIGIPDTISLHESDSLGFQLIKMLAVDQLDGEIEVHRNKGATVTLKIPIKEQAE